MSDGKRDTTGGSSGIIQLIERNISASAKAGGRGRGKSVQIRVADWITAFCGSMAFVYLHVIWFGAWMAVNLGLLPVPAFDPYPFGLLTMIVSLEAIFLSTFVLISQNTMQWHADRRSELDLQINLLAEHEVTRVIKLLDAIADRLGVEEGRGPELEELKNDVLPEEILHKMDLIDGKQREK